MGNSDVPLGCVPDLALRQAQGEALMLSLTKGGAAQTFARQLFGYLIDVVNNLLRERNRDTVGLKLFLELLGQIPANAPVISGIHPDPDNDIH